MPRQWYHISELCRQATKVLFFQLHTVVKLFFNDTIIFATRHQYQLQPEGDITVCGNNSVCWRLQALFSKNVWNKLRDKILVEICECGWWTEFAKTSVCIILVVLVYLESAKIYTGPEIVRVLKKLGNTGLHNNALGRWLADKNKRVDYWQPEVFTHIFGRKSNKATNIDLIEIILRLCKTSKFRSVYKDLFVFRKNFRQSLE